MIRVAIVEDEEMYTATLKKYLAEYEKASGEGMEITIYRDGDGILEEYRAQFDIILMDIEMKFVNGMTAAEEIRRRDSEVIIIFITNTPQYAIRGYEVDALDYVLKPVSYFSFSQKLERAISRMRKRSAKLITVPVKGGVKRMDISDIYYIESQGHNLIYHTRFGDTVSPGTMKAAEAMLEDMHFSRGNKCYLINLEHVDGVKDKFATVRDEQLLLSRPRMRQFMQDLTKYWGDLK
ncbi:MAG TPA: LytTR family DNA-binding domain-containing protein [Candidatus Bariatricus faecipullorum]|nr:LytTR family DNA-binding domain-containing protein [Candidatus Bariatricus faecipullorum]